MSGLAAVLVICAVFFAGVVVYGTALAWWPLLLVWWRPLLAGVAALVVFGAWWLWWRLPKRQVDRLRHAIRDPKARTDVEDNFRKTIGQLLGGAAVLIGAGFAYLQFQQQQTSAHDLLISNQVSKGFDQLGQGGDDKIAVRLGGIYALEGVMNTSEQYHRAVLEALSAFVRDKTQPLVATDVAEKMFRAAMKLLGAAPTQHQLQDDLFPPATDVQAALTVIGRRKTGDGRINLVGAHIQKADLSEANLTGAYLRGARLTGANLTVANLTSASLIDADLTDALLAGAHLDRAILFHTILVGARLNTADLTGAWLIGADLRGAQGLTQEQLDQACGFDVKLDPPLTFHRKPCPIPQPK